MQRRDLLRAFGAATALAIIPRDAMAAWARVASGIRPAAGLTDAQLALVGAIADVILPRTDSPSATDVDVPAFIDVIVSENYSDAERTAFLAGLDPRFVDGAGRGDGYGERAGTRVRSPGSRPTGARKSSTPSSARRPSRRTDAHLLATQRPRDSRLFHERARVEGRAPRRGDAGPVRRLGTAATKAASSSSREMHDHA